MDFNTLEAARQDYAHKLRIFYGVTGAVFALAAILVILSINSSSRGIQSVLWIVFVLMLIAICGVGIFIYQSGARARYHQLYKAYFVETALRQTFTDIQYDHALGMPKSVLSSTGMIQTGDKYQSNDFTSGKYKNVAFAQADVTIKEEHTDNDGNTYYVTIFRGRWLTFEFPKPFTFRLQIVQKHFRATKKFAKDKATMRRVEKLSTESTTFDQKFRVYSEDGFEAYYILDPAFIDRIEQLSAASQGKLLLCFIGNKLHVAIDDKKDAFEPPSPFRPINQQAESAKVRQDIKAITDLVDFLKLDRKLFKTT